MSDSAFSWSRRVIRIALLALITLMPAVAIAEWKQIDPWPEELRELEPGAVGVAYDDKLYKYFWLKNISTKQGELIQVTVGSYSYQPAVTVLDANDEPQGRSRHNEPELGADGRFWYATVLRFECCPGANSGEFETPTKYVLRFNSQEINAVGVALVTGGRFVWVEPEPVVDLGPFECNCQDPASGKWYEGSMGGTMCPPVTPETRFCTEP